MASAKKGCVIVGIIGAVLLFCCGGGMGIFVYVLFQFTSGAVNAGDEFLTKLGNGQISEAYQSAAQTLRNTQTETDFTAAVQQMGLNKYQSSLWLNRSVNNDTAELKGTVYLADGQSQSMTMQLVKEDDTWKVLSFIGTGVTTAPPELAPAPVVEDAPPTGLPVDPSASPPPTDAVMEEPSYPPGPPPNEDEARALATLALLEFHAGLESGDFTAFCDQASATLRAATTPADIANNFLALKYQQVGFGDVTADELEFAAEPAVSERNLLSVVGSLYRGVVRLDFDLTFVYEGDDWKLAGLSVKAIPSEDAIPEETELQQLVTQSLLGFSEGIQAKDFTAFHANCAEAFQQQASPEDLANAFQVFTQLGLDLSHLRDQPPEFTTAPAINEEGLLLVEGRTPVSGFSFKFDVKYSLEGDQWKLFGINGSLE